MKQIFVTGMLRSGTSLLQILLTNHPKIFLAYQPFFQLYIDTKKMFLKQYELSKLLPLGDGMDTSTDERALFTQWLISTTFNTKDIKILSTEATQGTGGSATSLPVNINLDSGNFFEIRQELHQHLSKNYPKEASTYIGSKEILCEEYIEPLISKGDRCLLIIRDPRAVIASANNGNYRQAVGDRYPILMLIRLWRKSAAYWLALRNNPAVFTVRYEDLVQNPEQIMNQISNWLNLPKFGTNVFNDVLYDHTGKVWKGNSSFGDMAGIERTSESSWKTMLTDKETKLIEACTNSELSSLGYQCSTFPQRESIESFVEDTEDVRKSYLGHYDFNEVNKKVELERWDFFENKKYKDLSLKEKSIFGFSDKPYE